ncbi:MAG: hypothetical protein FJ267_00990 [Planctomycetes bacterium]|nr:hypothetical protein [Planctomycetota bacterium]
MNNQNVRINRPLVGVLSLGLMAIAGLLWLSGIEGNQEMWSGACLKVGVVLGALWLALPSLTRTQDFGTASAGAILAVIVVILMIGRTKVPLSIIIPAVMTFAFVIRLLSAASKR